MANNNRSIPSRPEGEDLTVSYFDKITGLLNQFDEAQAAKQAARGEVTKTFLLTDIDVDTGEIKTYRMTMELISTAQGHLEPLTLEVDRNDEIAEGDYYN